MSLASDVGACLVRFMDIAQRVKALRAALRMTQEELAEAGIFEGHPLAREEVVKLENGRNKAQAARTVGALAHATMVSMDDMQAYLSGRIELEALLRRKGWGTVQLYSNLPGWRQAKEKAMARFRLLPAEAFAAADECPMFRPVDAVDELLVSAIAAFMWFTMTPTEQAEFTSRAQREQLSIQISRKPSGSMPTAKRLSSPKR